MTNSNLTAETSRDCAHGQLARSCEICEKDARIAELERDRDYHTACITKLARVVSCLGKPSEVVVNEAIEIIADVRDSHEPASDPNPFDPTNPYFRQCMEGHIGYSKAFAECPSCKIERERASSEPKGRRWMLLLTGERNGLVGGISENFVNHPAHYERVEVVERYPSETQPAEPKEIADDTILPQAWMRLHHSPGSPSEPPETDWEVVAGEDKPDDGAEWIPLYAARVVVNQDGHQNAEPSASGGFGTSEREPSSVRSPNETQPAEPRDIRVDDIAAPILRIEHGWICIRDADERLLFSTKVSKLTDAGVALLLDGEVPDVRAQFETSDVQVSRFTKPCAECRTEMHIENEQAICASCIREHAEEYIANGEHIRNALNTGAGQP
jgi:hypothetical protein